MQTEFDGTPAAERHSQTLQIVTNDRQTGGRILSNYYAVLNVSPNSDRKSIRAAYLALISKYHPDTWQGEAAQAERYSKLINEAYSVLHNERRRAAYDLSLRGGNEVARAPARRFVTNKSVPVPHVPLRRFAALWLALGATAVAVGVSYSNSNLAPRTAFRGGDSIRLTNFAATAANRSGPSNELGTVLTRPERADPESAYGPGILPAAIQASDWDVRSETFYESALAPTEELAKNDQLLVQSICSWATAKGSAEYQACLSRYFDEILTGAIYPSTKPVEDKEMLTVQLACEPSQIEGAAVNDICLRRN